MHKFEIVIDGDSEQGVLNNIQQVCNSLQEYYVSDVIMVTDDYYYAKVLSIE